MANIQEESREYPSRLFYMDLLLKEVQKAGESGKTLDEVIDQLREIWTARNRVAVITQLEYHLDRRRDDATFQQAQDLIGTVLLDLVLVADRLKKGDRYKVDLTVNRLIGYLEPEQRLQVLEPWFQESRKFRINAVRRAFRSIDNLESVAHVLVDHYRADRDVEMLKLIARTPNAAEYIQPDELDSYFTAYINNFKSDELYSQDRKYTKYYAMLAAKVLIIGNNSIPPQMMRASPEVFSWAIDEIGDPVHEAMLIWLIAESPNNPEVLWSAIRTSGRRFMSNALDRALQAAHQLLWDEEGVIVLQTDIVEQKRLL